ncbi:MAG: molybdenum cofactor guanylyltransferase [Promethearchaeota archaeon]|nr:MAG: molybdenum cofactor guanylyltransferase [Candidatus Lokiarchaeota archaeon]
MSNITKKSKNFAIVILVGGKSTRFGSDKGLFQFHGKPLISYQLETLASLNLDIFIVAHSNQQVQNYIEKIDITKIMAFIIDDQSLLSSLEEQTPLLGLYSAFKELNKIGYEKTLVLACDIPLIQKNVIEYLISNCNDFDCCIPQWDNGFLEPLLAVYPVKKGLISTIKNLKNGNYKLINLIEKNWKINFISIEKVLQSFDKKLLSFININSFRDLKRI